MNQCNCEQLWSYAAQRQWRKTLVAMLCWCIMEFFSLRFFFFLFSFIFCREMHRSDYICNQLQNRDDSICTILYRITEKATTKNLFRMHKRFVVCCLSAAYHRIFSHFFFIYLLLLFNFPFDLIAKMHSCAENAIDFFFIISFVHLFCSLIQK